MQPLWIDAGVLCDLILQLIGGSHMLLLNPAVTNAVPLHGVCLAKLLVRLLTLIIKTGKENIFISLPFPCIAACQ